jgi:ferrous-iron efflux pump FieF
MMISAFIFWATLTFGKDSILSLMDVSPNKEIQNAIEQTIIDTPAMKGVHGLKVRRSGPFVFAEAHVEVDGRTSVNEAHAVADAVEDRVKRTFKTVDSIVIHIGMVHESHKRPLPSL